jgi:hypothetical protein
MWFWIIKSIAGSIIGSASSSWFQNTALGRWFFQKTSDLYDWAADRYDLKILNTEDSWRQKYPNIAYKMEELEKRISELENNK